MRRTVGFSTAAVSLALLIVMTAFVSPASGAVSGRQLTSGGSASDSAAQPPGAAGGPVPLAAVTYTISVMTSDIDDAGTDSKVEVRLNGTAASSGYMVLDSSIDNFERKTTDVFSRVLTDLGTLQSADLRFTLGGGSPGWHLANIKVTATGKPTVYFVCYCWFSSSTTRTLAAAVNPQTYIIQVVTSDIEDAGTDGTVEIRLRGSLRSSPYMILDTSIDNFERDSTNTFTRVVSDIGAPRSVDIRFTLGGNSAWHLSHVTLSMPTTAQFPCHCWFSSSTTRNVPAA